MSTVAAKCGLTIIADNGFKLRYYTLLCDPVAGSGKFLVATFIDADLYRVNTDVWEVGEPVTALWQIEKPSVIHVHTVRMRDQLWIDQTIVKNLGVAPGPVVARIRCALCLYESLIEPADRPPFDRFKEEWCADCP